MKGIYVIIAVLALTMSGCARLNPQMQQQIDNQDGKIDEIRNNQNGISLELGKLKQQAEITDSELNEVQQGMINMNNAISRNENSGVQILQGDGALILVFALGVIGMILWHYRERAVKSEKTSEILAQQIAEYDDPQLNDGILRAAMFTESEKDVYKLLKKHYM